MLYLYRPRRKRYRCKRRASVKRALTDFPQSRRKRNNTQGATVRKSKIINLCQALRQCD